MFLNRYSGLRVLVTGDTGFKGSWIIVFLRALGAHVHGLALPPSSEDDLFCRARLDSVFEHTDGDIRDVATITRVFESFRPDLVFHLAAQALVGASYRDPVGTMQTNVVGTMNVCEAVRLASHPCALVVVTSDKCYENREWVYAYRENDSLGGADPYSASKAAAEIVTNAWRSSFLPAADVASHRKPIATVRAGNVIGPGDWASNRILPDAIRALLAGAPVHVRNPKSVRPWQHVLEPLSGYLWLGACLCSNPAPALADSWNFGPLPSSIKTVEDLVKEVIASWGYGTWTSTPSAQKESKLLRLTIDKSVAELRWAPVWEFRETVEKTVEGYKKLNGFGRDHTSVYSYMAEQVQAYVASAQARNVPWTQV